MKNANRPKNAKLTPSMCPVCAVLTHIWPGVKVVVCFSCKTTYKPAEILKKRGVTPT